MKETADVIDDVTPKLRDGSVHLSQFEWAKHRYTMAFLMAIVISLVLGVPSVLVHDYLTYRRKVDAWEADRTSKIYDHEQRLAKVEDKADDLMSAFSAVRDDLAAVKDATYQIRTDVSVLKSRMPPQ